MTAGIRQPGQGRKDRTTRKGKENRTGRTEQAKQDKQNMTGRTGQEELDRQNWTDRTGQSEQDGQNGISRTRQPEQNPRTGLSEQDCQNMTVRRAASAGIRHPGKKGEDSHKRAFRTERDSQNKTS